MFCGITLAAIHFGLVISLSLLAVAEENVDRYSNKDYFVSNDSTETTNTTSREQQQQHYQQQQQQQGEHQPLYLDYDKDEYYYEYNYKYYNDKKRTSIPNCDKTDINRQYQPIECWLWDHLKLSIPDQSFHSSIFKLELKDLVCTNFEIKSVSSRYDPSNTAKNSNNPNPKFQISINTVHANCIGKYTASPFHISGNVEAIISGPGQDQGDSIVIELEVLSGSSNNNNSTIRIGQAVKTSSCKSDGIQLSDIHFTGSFSAKIIDNFKNIIADYITNALHDLVCPQIRLNVDPLLTNIMKIINKFLLKYVISNESINHSNEIDGDNVDDYDGDNVISSDRTSTLMKYITSSATLEKKFTDMLTASFLHLKDGINWNKKKKSPQSMFETSNDKVPDRNEYEQQISPELMIEANNNGLSDSTNNDKLLSFIDTYENEHRAKYKESRRKQQQKQVRTSILDSSSAPPSTIDFRLDTPILISILKSFNTRFLQTYLNEGFILHFLKKHLDVNVTNNDYFCTKNCGGFFRGINGLIHNLIHLHGLDKNVKPSISIPIPNFLHNLSYNFEIIENPEFSIHNMLLTTEINIANATISGLDQIDRLSILHPRSSSINSDNASSTGKASNTTTFESGLSLMKGLNVTTYINLKILSQLLSITDLVNDDEKSTKDYEYYYDDKEGPQGVSSRKMLDGNNQIIIDQLLQVNLDISDITVLSNIFASIDKMNFTRLSVGNLLDMIINPTQNSSQSFLSLFPTVKILDLMTSLNVNATSFIPLLCNDLLEIDLVQLSNNFLHLFLNEYHAMITQSIRGLIQGPLRQSINDWIGKQLLLGRIQQNQEYTLESRPQQQSAKWVNFTTIQALYEMNKFLDQIKTLNATNEFLDCAIRFISTVLHLNYNSTNINRGIKDNFLLHNGYSNPRTNHDHDNNNKYSNISFLNVREFEIQNVGKIDNVELCFPDKESSEYLNNKLYWITNNRNDNKYGNNSRDMSRTISDNLPNFFSSFDFSYPYLNISGDFNVSVFVSNMHLGNILFIKYDFNKLRDYPFLQLLSSSDGPWCAMVPSDKLEIKNILNGSNIESLVAKLVGTIAMRSSAAEDDTINFNASIDQNSDIFATISNIADISIQIAQDGANVGAKYLEILAINLCKSSIETSSSSYLSPNSSSTPSGYDKNGEEVILSRSFFYTCAFLFLLQPAFLALIWYSSTCDAKINDEIMTSREENENTMSLLLSDTSKIDLDDVQTSSITTTSSRGLVHSPLVSMVARHFIPVFIGITTMLLLSSNFSTGASIDLSISSGSSKIITLPSVFQFSLVNTAVEMFDGHIYLLFILVVVFSGIWPYIKLFLMLFALILPPTTLSAYRRGHLLLALDALGKLSLVDTYVFVLMIVAFRYHVAFSDVVSFDVFVTPWFGFYSFLMATCFSLIAGHLAVFMHRRVEYYLPSEITTPKESVFGHSFAIRNGSEHRKFSSSFKVQLLLFILIAGVLLAIGITKESFIFEFGGIAGFLLGDGRQKEFSLLSIGTSLSSSVEDPFSVGIICLQAIYFFYAAVTPFVCLVLILLLLNVPMTLSVQQSFLSIAETVNAWSAVEVFALSIAAALYEIPSFASVIIGDRCNLINQLLREYLDNGILEDPTCFTVRASLKSNVWLFIAGVLMNSFIVSLTLRFIRCAIYERISLLRGQKNLPSSVDAHDFSLDDTIVTFLIRQGMINRVFDIAENSFLEYRENPAYVLGE